MSVSKHTLEEAHLALLTNGQIALCDQTKKGTLRVHRVISREEMLNLITVFYSQFRQDNPTLQVLQIPISETSVIAVAEMQVTKE